MTAMVAKQYSWEHGLLLISGSWSGNCMWDFKRSHLYVQALLTIIAKDMSPYLCDTTLINPFFQNTIWRECDLEGLLELLWLVADLEQGILEKSFSADDQDQELMIDWIITHKHSLQKIAYQACDISRQIRRARMCSFFAHLSSCRARKSRLANLQ